MTPPETFPSLSHPLFVGSNYVFLEETASTNAYLQLRLRERNLPEGTVVSAGFQSQGRGQAGAEWESGKNQNIMLSVFLHPKFMKPTAQFGISKAMALAVQDLLCSLLHDVPIKIKWPNDILVSGQKICGILIENALKGDTIDYCIVGLGININEIFSDTRRTSLKTITGLDYDLRYVEKILFSCIEARYLQLKNHPETVSNDYLTELYGMGIKMRYQDNLRNEHFEGTIQGINPKGRLIIESDTGLRLYNTKEITNQL